MIKFRHMLWSVILLALIASVAWGQLPTKGLVLYLTMEEGKGNIINDQSGNGSKATITGDPKWVKGKFGTGIEFDGETNYAVVNHNPVFDFTEMTAAAWVNWSGLSAGYRFVMCQWGSPGNEWILRVDNKGNFAAVWFIDGKVQKDTERKPFPQGQWQHIAIAHRDGAQTIYRDGEVAVSAKRAGKLAVGKDNVFIGANGTEGDKFGGILDELALWNRALTQDEIKMTMQGITPVRPEGSITTLWGRLKLKS